ncbi:Anthocyanin 3'-O-beta-glucosyltransferase [Hibiscus syriacus]|uniref:Anthocyanin 3'-O-beta-glucosyltransferase n=1 Tax=Hibiscus syriacus TaxID=106335 RepID=A0A6A2ZLU0_HIBSY|nr:uncharacterized protein At4g06744-like [Hibiscus syriacus]KAE8692670.1 Anthocyanin 3'-O-beta-glucosyltransferase [Hibiscus syriacus]
MQMRSLSISTSFLFFAVVFHSCLAINDDSLIKRKALDIIIGGGEGPSPDDEPPPCKHFENENGCFENERLAKAYEVIQRFKSKIKVDKNSNRYLKTWCGTDVCKYSGFRCDIRPDVNEKAVAAVDFNGFKFEGCDGTLPLDGFLDELDDLAIFHANSNNFTGTVPFRASKIKYLYELDLSNNKIAGNFPMKTVGGMNLTFLDLRFNSLRGSVPPQAFNLKLDVFFINNNRFAVQSLPTTIGDTTAVYLTFANNNFTGSIPPSIGRARNLLEVLFLNNRLTGCLPYEIGNLSQATVFDASSNKLTGPIPLSFGCMKNIQILGLANNQFYGEVPEIVCELPMIANLSLANNYFTSIGPACRRLMLKKKIDVKKNCIFDLPNQRSEAECAAFLWKTTTCNRMETLFLVPCEIHGYYSENSSDGDQSAAADPATRTYSTLSPHHRL